MATSIQTIDDQAEIINDLDLLALITLLNDTATKADDGYSSLYRFIEEWVKSCSSYGPGTLDLRLEEIVADHSAKEEMKKLLVVVENTLDGFGESIPTSLLAVCNAPGVTFKNYSTSHIRSTIERLRNLMNRVTA